MAPESEPDEEDEGLAKLLTPGRMHDSASTARFTTADAAPGASPSQGADAARSAGPSTSESQQQRCTLPPELAEEPPDPVDPAIQVHSPTCSHLPRLASSCLSIADMLYDGWSDAVFSCH